MTFKLDAESFIDTNNPTLWRILRKQGLSLDMAQKICNEAYLAGIIGDHEADLSERIWRALRPIGRTLATLDALDRAGLQIVEKEASPSTKNSDAR